MPKSNRLPRTCTRTGKKPKTRDTFKELLNVSKLNFGLSKTTQVLILPKNVLSTPTAKNASVAGIGKPMSAPTPIIPPSAPAASKLSNRTPPDPALPSVNITNIPWNSRSSISPEESEGEGNVCRGNLRRRGCETNFFISIGRDGALRRPGVAARRPYLEEFFLTPRRLFPDDSPDHHSPDNCGLPGRR